MGQWVQVGKGNGGVSEAQLGYGKVEEEEEVGYGEGGNSEVEGGDRRE